MLRHDLLAVTAVALCVRLTGTSVLSLSFLRKGVLQPQLTYATHPFTAWGQRVMKLKSLKWVPRHPLSGPNPRDRCVKRKVQRKDKEPSKTTPGRGRRSPMISSPWLHKIPGQPLPSETLIHFSTPLFNSLLQSEKDKERSISVSQA